MIVSPSAGILTVFPQAEASMQCVAILIMDDLTEELDETILLSVTGPGVSTATSIVIVDNDGITFFALKVWELHAGYC